MNANNSLDEYLEKKSLRFLKNNALSTQKNYVQAVKRYETLHNMDIDDLVAEALDEQLKQVPPHLLKVIDRIDEFQESLRLQGLVYGTIKTFVSNIKTLYRKNRVLLPNFFAQLNPKTTRRREYIEYKDVLTKDEIRCALNHMRLPAQARVMAMIQGGLSNEECEHLTTRSFIDELYKYHQKDDDREALKWLADENNPVIWVTKLIRQKTKKPYYAILGAEAINKIAESKLYELQLPSNNGEIPQKLLNMEKSSFGRICRKVNDRCEFGLVSEEAKLKPHNLRRFHATRIKDSVSSYEEGNRISLADIDEMQGRGKTLTQDTYIKSNPFEQKLLYAKVMNNVSLFHEYEYEIIDGDVCVFIKNHMMENKELTKKVNQYKRLIDENKKANERIEALKEEFGEETLRLMIIDMLNTS